jgi:O-antigen ligase
MFFWLGLMFAGLSAGFFAIFQVYFDSSHWERASGYMNAIQFGDISFLTASLMLCGVVWATYVLKNKYVAVLFLVSSLFGFFASFLSLSRGGWIAAPFVLYVLFLVFKPANKKMFLAFGAVGIFMTVALFIVMPQTNPIKVRILETGVDLTNFSQGELNSESTSFYTRVQMWKNGIDAFSERPIVGWGDITAIKNHYPVQWGALNAIDNFNHLHNEYLDALAKHGLVGFIMLMALFLVPLRYFLSLMREGSEESTAFAVAGVILIVCVMVFGLTQTFMAHNSGVTIFAFYLVIIRAYCRNGRLAPNEKVFVSE